MKILIATANAGKLREFRDLMDGKAEVVSLADVRLPSPPEDGDTFEANAELKAKHAASMSGLLTLADDSGLEVDALHGAPGIYSARYAGAGATDMQNRSLLLERLRSVPPELRGARFVSVVSVCTPDGACTSFRGVWEGHIALAERGAGGFGYDPVFELADGRTAAELTTDVKNRLSHRAIALGNALPYVQSLIAAGRCAT